jgi:hypothetical protein
MPVLHLLAVEPNLNVGLGRHLEIGELPNKHGSEFVVHPQGDAFHCPKRFPPVSQPQLPSRDPQPSFPPAVCAGSALTTTCRALPLSSQGVSLKSQPWCTTSVL